MTSESNRKYFEHRLKRINTELVHARGYIQVWEQLWPTTDKIARVENRYRTFFGYARMALNHQFFLCLAKVIEDRRRKDNLNIWKLLRLIENEPSMLMQPLDVEELKQKLVEKQELLQRITDYRDKELAHIDDKYYLDTVMNQEDTKKISILLGEVKTLEKDLEDIVNEISSAFNHSQQVFETLQHKDTTRLLNDTIKWLYHE